MSNDFWKDYEPEPTRPAPVQEPVAWRFTGIAGFKRFVTDAQHKGLPLEVRAWYEPFKCASCTTPPAAQPAPVQEPVWIQPDHLQKAQKAPTVQGPVEDALHFAQWTAAKKDLSNYICVGSLTLAGIEDGEYGQSEIDSLENTIEALQERLVTGYEHKKVPLLAYIGGLNTTPAAAQRQWVGLTHKEHMEIMTGAMTASSRMAAVEAKLKEKNT
jgi:hypothetical protein